MLRAVPAFLLAASFFAIAEPSARAAPPRKLQITRAARVRLGLQDAPRVITVRKGGKPVMLLHSDRVMVTRPDGAFNHLERDGGGAVEQAQGWQFGAVQMNKLRANLGHHELQIYATGTTAGSQPATAAGLAKLQAVQAMMQPGADVEQGVRQLEKLGMAGKTGVVIDDGRGTLDYVNLGHPYAFTVARRVPFPSAGRIDYPAAVVNLQHQLPSVPGEKIDWNAVALVGGHDPLQELPDLNSVHDGRNTTNRVGRRTASGMMPFISVAHAEEGATEIAVRFGLHGEGPVIFKTHGSDAGFEVAVEEIEQVE